MANVFQTEMQLHNGSGNRGRCLEQVYNHLLSTSVVAKRAVSAAGVLCINLRSWLAGDSIDTLCCLHSYYSKDRI